MTNVQIELQRLELYEAQDAIKKHPARFKVVMMGRRAGKTFLGQDVVIDPLLKGKPVGWFAPTYRLLLEVWRETAFFCRPVTKRASQTERRIELITGGVLEMWSLEDTDAGRSRKYARVIVDEAGLVPQLDYIWNNSIRPTLTDYKGDAYFFGTPKGRNYFWSLFLKGQDPLETEWASWQLPTAVNPYIDPTEIEAAAKGMPERAFRQEYLAEALEDGGGVFRGVEKRIRTGDSANLTARMAGRSYYLGVDLARYEDFTALTVMDDVGTQVFHDRFNALSWERQIERIIDVAGIFSATVVMDSTGVGDPVLEATKRRAYERGIELQFVPEDGFVFTTTSKEQLIDSLAVAIEREEISLMDIPAQTAELLAYQYEVTAGGRLRMNAPRGMHDDTVIALALANWGRRQVTLQAPIGIHSLGEREPSYALAGDRGWVNL